MMCIGFFFSFSICGAQTKGETPQLLPFVSLDTSVSAAPYRMSDILSNQPDRMLARANMAPKIYWYNQIKTGVKLGGCAPGFQRTNFGYAKTDQETIEIWRQLSSGGYAMPANSTSTLRYEAFSMTGLGAGVDCELKPTMGLRLIFGFSMAHLQDYKFGRYAGVASSSGGISSIQYGVNKWAHTGYLDTALQPDGKASAHWFNAQVDWQDPTQPLSFALNLPILLGKLKTSDSPYLEEALDLTTIDGKFRNNSGNIASGRYGNRAFTHALPAYWRTELSYRMSTTLAPTYYAEGVSGMRTEYLGNRWRLNEGGTLVMDWLIERNLKQVLIRMGQDSWNVGLGFVLRTNEMTQPVMLQARFLY